MGVKRVAVIGAGASGLPAVKCCLDEGFEPTCFERTGELGGLWHYTGQVREDQACVMMSTVINTSKEMTCYSDFPMPAGYPNFLHNSMVLRYLKEYTDHFYLDRYIHYNTEVLVVRPAPDFDQTGRWDLKVLDRSSGEETQQTFDAVMVCTGHHAKKNMPSLPGLHDFQGSVLHSQEYKEPSEYVGKRVLIVGMGNSAGDAAVELSRSAQVYLSTRRGSWITNRINRHGGLPSDVSNMRRLKMGLVGCLPEPVKQRLLAHKFSGHLDHDLYSLRPAFPPTALYPIVNDDLVNRIACGSVHVKDDVKRFTATGVEFKDGSFEDNIDLVLLATGYNFGFPFIDKSVVDVKENRIPFYKYIFPPDLKHPTLAAIGCVQTLGSVIPISEMQSRLATRVFKGDIRLPPSHRMWEDIRAKEAEMSKQMMKSPRYTVQVHFIFYMDELAEIVGCKPDFMTLLKLEPALVWRVWTGPCVPAQYRLLGPGRWEGARDTIMTVMDRVRYPLATRPLPQVSDMDRVKAFFVRVALVIAVVLVMGVFVF